MKFNIKKWIIPIILTLIISSITIYFGVKNGGKNIVKIEAPIKMMEK